MTEFFNELDHRYVDYLVKLAIKNQCHGIIEEPRGYFDVLRLNPVGVLTEGQPETFINGEQFPIRLVYMSTALIPQWDASPLPLGIDERFIQRVGLRFKFHDSYYMASDFAAAPLWINKIVAAADSVTQASSTILFERPVILSARDSLRVRVQLASVPASPRNVRVGFTGTGMVSKQPYFFNSAMAIDDDRPHQLNPTRYRNDGPEPVALTDMSIDCGAEEEDADGVGDIRQVSINVNQIGNGTQADWWRGPSTADLTLERIPGVLCGYNTGRAIVHRFPGDGLLWEPGEGVTVEAEALSSTVENLDVGVALFGYISVT